MITRDVLAVFNRGRISRLALARTDVARVALSAEVQTNWLSRTLGAMSLRPGFQYMGDLLGNGVDVPFIFSNTDTAILDLTAAQMRVWVSGTDLVERVAVGATVANGALATDLTSWTDADEVGAVSDYLLGMRLLGTGSAAAKRQQAVTTTDPTLLHALRITVSYGPVILRVGTTAGADDIVAQAVLRGGTHSIAFVPGGTFHIEFSSFLSYPVTVTGCTIEAAGPMILPTPWTTVALCQKARWQQSGDVVFVACDGVQQQRIERRANNSWSVVVYEANDGPFLTENVDTVTLSPSALSGSVTLTASRAVFQAGHVGALFRITSQGQRVQEAAGASLVFTDPIRVTGVGVSRTFAINISGTWVGTVSLQRSIGEIGTWVTTETFTANEVSTRVDGLDNAIIYYRLGFEAGNWTSGIADLDLFIGVGSITGTARVTEYTSETVVTASVLSPFGSTAASDIWSEGEWSDYRGWPQAVGLSEGRLWWSGNGRNYGSLPDGFSIFDPDTIGDSQPINRRIGDGVVSATNWVLPMQHLIVGTDGAESSVRSTSFEEPVTPSNYNAKSRTTKGSAPVPAVMADNTGYFVGKTETQVFELQYDPAAYGYAATDTMLLCPEIGEAGVVRLGIQQSPDARLHCVRDDGTVAMLLRDPVEDVKCWLDIETDGRIEDVVILPGTGEDRVFYRIRRTIDGVITRRRERWAMQSECVGGLLNKQADSFVTGTGPVTGLDHLEGETVVVWADGADLGEFVVTAGAVDATGTTWCAGLPYEAQYQSAKLAGQTSLGLSLTQQSRINYIGLVLADTHAQGLEFGPGFGVLDSLPLMEDEDLVDPDSVWESYDKDMIEFPGSWSNDNRVCLVARAPRPCTVLGVVLSIDRQDK